MPFVSAGQHDVEYFSKLTVIIYMEYKAGLVLDNPFYKFGAEFTSLSLLPVANYDKRESVLSVCARMRVYVSVLAGYGE